MEIQIYLAAAARSAARESWQSLPPFHSCTITWEKCMGEMGEIKMEKIPIQTHLSILADFSLGLERVVPLALLSPPKQIINQWWKAWSTWKWYLSKTFLSVAIKTAIKSCKSFATATASSDKQEMNCCKLFLCRDVCRQWLFRRFLAKRRNYFQNTVFWSWQAFT